MTLSSIQLTILAVLFFALSACDGAVGATGPIGTPGQAGAPSADNERDTIQLKFLGRRRNPGAEFDESAAEIVAFDPASPHESPHQSCHKGTRARKNRRALG